MTSVVTQRMHFISGQRLLGTGRNYQPTHLQPYTEYMSNLFLDDECWQHLPTSSHTSRPRSKVQRGFWAPTQQTAKCVYSHRHPVYLPLSWSCSGAADSNHAL